jgi:hypothetical protein
MVKFLKTFLFTLILFMGFNSFAFATEGDVVRYEDVIKSIVALVSNYKGMGGIAIAGAIIMIAVQVLKTTIISGLFKSEVSKLVRKIIVLILGTAGGVLALKLGGVGWIDALVAGVLSSGAAMSIYELIKKAFKKPKTS